MSIRIYRRKGSPYYQLDITVEGQRIRRSSQTADRALAREKAATIEANLFRTAWHGERRGARSFAEAVVSYLKAAPRSDNHKARINRLLLAMGDLPLAQIDQQNASELKDKLMRPDAAPGTYTRAIVMPLGAILHHAHKLSWCDPPHIVAPRENQGRTLFLLPAEVDRLVDGAALHLKPLLIFLVGTGARMSEAIELDWRDVDLPGARAIFWRTKTGVRRLAQLSPRIVAALANLAHREGPVFRWQTAIEARTGAAPNRPYADRGRRYGGQIKTGWAASLQRAGLSPEFTPHDCRHTWASWHYALHKDLIRLKQEGGWSSVALVERYAHLLPVGYADAIRSWHRIGTLHGAIDEMQNSSN
jgi:integrase